CGPVPDGCASARSRNPATSNRSFTTAPCCGASSEVTPDARPHGRIPCPPDPTTDRVARFFGPQLLRPVLLQRSRPYRRHLPDLRHRLLPEPRRKGCLCPRPARE